jgi:hypothetical protein
MRRRIAADSAKLLELPKASVEADRPCSSRAALAGRVWPRAAKFKVKRQSFKHRENVARGPVLFLVSTTVKLLKE